MLEKYGHGGDQATAEELYGKPDQGWLDFSANMNPWGPPSVVEEVLRTRWQEITRYPDPAVRRLTAQLASRYGIPSESILVGNGAAELIDLCVRVDAPPSVAVTRPSFSEYEEAARKTGCPLVDIPLSADEDFMLSKSRVERAEDAALYLLGHPNNPTGSLVPADVVQSLLDRGRRVVLDEAFIDFVPDERQVSWIRQAAGDPKLCVIRSMTKFYAIPGLRLGFIVSHPDRIAKLREQQVPWSVNQLAQVVGEAVLQDDAFEAHSIRWLHEERPWLVEQLEKLGLVPVPGIVNYILFSIPTTSGWNAPRAQDHLGRRGILVRDASRFPGLDASCVRVAVRRRGENEQLVEALRGMLNGEGGTDGAR